MQYKRFDDKVQWPSIVENIEKSKEIIFSAREAHEKRKKISQIKIKKMEEKN